MISIVHIPSHDVLRTFYYVASKFKKNAKIHDFFHFLSVLKEKKIIHDYIIHNNVFLEMCSVSLMLNYNAFFEDYYEIKIVIHNEEIEKEKPVILDEDGEILKFHEPLKLDKNFYEFNKEVYELLLDHLKLLKEEVFNGFS
jgi:hypothetical protein